MRFIGKKGAALLLAAAFLGLPVTGCAAETPMDVAAETAGNLSGGNKNMNSLSTGEKQETSGQSEPLAGMPNPLVEYKSYEETAEVLGFPPLALPGSSGWQPTAYIVINNEMAELRYGKKWEPEVSFTVRSYRLAEGEEVSDISGLYGVRWWEENFEEQTVYTARSGEKSFAAMWNTGRYIFVAYGENMAYAPFWYLVTDSLLSQSGTYLYPAENDTASHDTP